MLLLNSEALISHQDRESLLHKQDCFDLNYDVFTRLDTMNFEDLRSTGVAMVHRTSGHTVLTSGGTPSAVAGMETIIRLLTMRDQINGPEVLIGAGVNAEIISHVRQTCPGARAFHMSGKSLVESGMRFRKQNVSMGLPGLDEWHIQQTSPQSVASARSALYSKL